MLSGHGIIVYGIICPHGPNFPWKDEGLEGWWQTVCEDGSALPVEVVKLNEEYDTIYVLTVPGTKIDAPQTIPQRFNPSDLVVASSDVSAFKTFLERLNIRTEGELGWMLGGFSED